MAKKRSVIWCAISGHGFGHTAQVVPVLNELGKYLSDVKVILRTNVPSSFFASKLEVSWELSPSIQDVGCVQEGPLSIDVERTWEAYRNFHQRWAQKVKDEAQAMRSVSPDLILSNISYLGIEVGAQLEVPALAMASLSWDQILQGFGLELTQEQEDIIAHIRAAYGKADLLTRLMPGISMDAFPRVVDVGPVGGQLRENDMTLKSLPYRSLEETLVLVGFGGVPQSLLPFDELNSMAGYSFVVDMPVPPEFQRLTPLPSIRTDFNSVFDQADIIVSKPGYATIIEAVAARKSIVYVRRYNFADEPPLVAYAHTFGRAVELTKEDLFAGLWQETLDTARSLPIPKHSPPESGTTEVVRHVMKFL